MPATPCISLASIAQKNAGVYREINYKIAFKRRFTAGLYENRILLHKAAILCDIRYVSKHAIKEYLS